mmetsp:Transcript_14227/g.41464  ORF Transcript_14227/g.41464 Transcript_14227/m.41464 type:complete len:225 (-) Transcript_14227:2998-3672(-)
MRDRHGAVPLFIAPLTSTPTPFLGLSSSECSFGPGRSIKREMRFLDSFLSDTPKIMPVGCVELAAGLMIVPSGAISTSPDTTSERHRCSLSVGSSPSPSGSLTSTCMIAGRVALRSTARCSTPAASRTSCDMTECTPTRQLKPGRSEALWITLSMSSSRSFANSENTLMNDATVLPTSRCGFTPNRLDGVLDTTDCTVPSTSTTRDSRRSSSARSHEELSRLMM